MADKKRIAAIDYGLARIGLALSDTGKILASPLGKVTAERRTESTAKKVAEALQEHPLDSIVIGLPYHMSGKMGCQADEVKHFAALLEQHVDCPIIFWDERLTTVQVERSMREAGISRKKRARVVDTLSAVVILQNYLDSLGLKCL